MATAWARATRGGPCAALPFGDAWPAPRPPRISPNWAGGEVKPRPARSTQPDGESGAARPGRKSKSQTPPATARNAWARSTRHSTRELGRMLCHVRWQFASAFYQIEINNRLQPKRTTRGTLFNAKDVYFRIPAKPLVNLRLESKPNLTLATKRIVDAEYLYFHFRCSSRER